MDNNSKAEIILYQPDNSLKLDVRLENETVWLSQTQMSELFGRDRTVINRHIRNVFAEGELQENEVCAKFAHTTQHGAITGKTQTIYVQFYNLDVIISVGYRVKSEQGTIFRQWANGVLKEYLLRGYAVNQHLRRIENFVLKTEQRVTITEHEIANIRGYIESFLADYNDINEDTRMQLELINESLAALQVKHKDLNEPRKPIGFRMG